MAYPAPDLAVKASLEAVAESEAVLLQVLKALSEAVPPQVSTVE